MHYKHLSEKEREIIFFLLQKWYKAPFIAESLWRDPSTIYREIERNSTAISMNRFPKSKDVIYIPDKAHTKYEKRIKEPKYSYPLKNPFIYQYTLYHLKEWRSPNAIAGRLKKVYKQSISHECIYQFIYSKKWRKLGLIQYLLRNHKKRKKRIYWRTKRHLIPNRIDISLRPKIIEKRKRIGDFEGDTIVSKNKTSGVITLVDRKSTYIIAKIFNKKKSSLVCEDIKKLFLPIKTKTKSLTLDNGSEFTKHELISEWIKIPVYFARPYHSWERWTNENANGIIRRFYPKWTEFSKVNPKEFDKIIDFINNTPRKNLNYKTPKEVFMWL